ncbi:MAG TPA: hypothetical protein VNV41_13915 [Candidatus Acidoferrales bacterium]|jgi:hypothetical protein|nr:hypothetical protein [Candidatus Acidoferrales bacterium]
MKRTAGLMVVTWLIAAPLYAQTASKLRVLTAPGMTDTAQKDWSNSLTVSDKTLKLTCPKCSPIQSVSVAAGDITSLRYGQNAYHHWVAGIVSGVLSLGVGLIVGLMPHHEHYFSIDTKDGKSLGIQADKSDFKQIAGMLQNFAALPIQVSEKDAHYLNGFNIQVTAEQEDKKDH